MAEFVTSFCLLSYSVINIIFDDTFGIIADQWRHSWKCLSLEILFSVSSRASCAFSSCLAIYFAVHIPSLTRRKSSYKVTFFQIVLMWFLITSICVTVQVLELSHNIDPFNYFCFPFTTLFPSNPLVRSFQVIMVIIDSLLVMITIISYGYLFLFTIRRRQNEALKFVDKSRSQLRKAGTRFALLIPLSHYRKNVIRTYYEHEMLKLVVKSAGNFSFSKIWAHNTTDVRT